MVVVECHFDNNARGRNMWPFHRHTEIMVAAAPSAGANEHIMAIVGKELTIDSLDIIGHIIIVHGRETVIIFHVNYIVDIVHDAMPQGIM